MVVLQGRKNTPKILKLSDFKDAFNKRNKTMMVGYDEDRVTFLVGEFSSIP